MQFFIHYNNNKFIININVLHIIILFINEIELLYIIRKINNEYNKIRFLNIIIVFTYPLLKILNI